MTRQDIAQKVEMRRLFWAMGAATRLEVRLAALVPRRDGRADRQEWTDVDVLGVHYAPVSGLSYVLADCKTVRGRATERIFWLRGVMDLFGAHAGYLVRDWEVHAAGRQLAARLGVTPLDPADRQALIRDLGDKALPAAGDLFSADRLTRWERLLGSAPGDVARLQRYRESTYWLAPRNRNLTYLPTVVRAHSQFLPANSDWGLAIVLDLAWLYLMAAMAAVDEMSRIGLSDLQNGLRQVIAGDERERREKEDLARRLRDLFSRLDIAGELPAVGPDPEFFGELLDLVHRLSRRRHEAMEALRVLEFVGTETVAGRGATWSEAFPTDGRLAVKLASDTIRFLVRACGLPNDFLQRFDDLTRRSGSATRGEADVSSASTRTAIPTVETTPLTTTPAAATLQSEPPGEVTQQEELFDTTEVPQ